MANINIAKSKIVFDKIAKIKMFDKFLALKIFHCMSPEHALGRF